MIIYSAPVNSPDERDNNNINEVIKHLQVENLYISFYYSFFNSIIFIFYL